MTATRPLPPVWLFILLLLGSTVGFVASGLLAVISVGAGRGGVMGMLSALSPVVVLALTAAGTVALRRRRDAVAAALFAPPILLGLWFLLTPHAR